MGQYYKAVMIDGDEVCIVDPWKSDNGAKLMEHSYIGNRFVNEVEVKIHVQPQRVAWIGDYSDDFTENRSELYEQKMTEEEFAKIYDIVWGDNRKECVSPTGDVILNDEHCDAFLVDHDREEYIDLAEYVRASKDKDGWCIDPLPLLTACGNDRGGGDFHEGNTGYEFVGMWAFDRIELSFQRPDGYEKLDVKFIEDGN